MGLILTIDEIHEHMEGLGLLNEQTSKSLLYGQVMPTTGQWLFFGNYALLAKGAYYVFAMEEERIILIPLGKMSGKINKKVDPIFIPFDELEEIKIKGGLMHSVTFLSQENELTLKFAKHGLGMKWHKENLERTMADIHQLADRANNHG
ncbi:hypothetical protein BW721_07090 [Jeotgalibaca sp. PTS2502]|uniref:hypothetical protein n=1 Tax=Jeotgalibaca sp. PTS2502 TaxID=1903686 RepID=UPI000973C87E|nr:hypothetical protein [Jeotgalibaca sp. PTS2502]APZ49461.1 hypothetical protein BW721_07090 [Jeotgalibaca sp. PTS2502]